MQLKKAVIPKNILGSLLDYDKILLSNCKGAIKIGEIRTYYHLERKF